MEREYELPPIWANSILRFAKNAAPFLASPTTLFHADPSCRVLVLTATSATAVHWLFLHESFISPTSHADRRIVPWIFWSQFCLIKEFAVGGIVGSPQVVGSRIIYLEKDGTQSPSGKDRTRIKVIDFSPYANIPVPSPQMWTHRGQACTLKPGEYQRDFKPNSSTTSGLAIERIFATEDNLVLFLVSQLYLGLYTCSSCDRKITGISNQSTF